MKTRKLVGRLLLLGALAILLAAGYALSRGVLVGASQEAGDQAGVTTCYYLYWDGLHRNEIVYRRGDDGSINMTTDACRAPT